MVRAARAAFISCLSENRWSNTEGPLEIITARMSSRQRRSLYHIWNEVLKFKQDSYCSVGCTPERVKRLKTMRSQSKRLLKPREEFLTPGYSVERVKLEVIESARRWLKVNPFIYHSHLAEVRS